MIKGALCKIWNCVDLVLSEDTVVRAKVSPCFYDGAFGAVEGMLPPPRLLPLFPNLLGAGMGVGPGR